MRSTGSKAVSLATGITAIVVSVVVFLVVRSPAVRFDYDFSSLDDVT